jgi:hypothetical protein
LDNGYLEYGSGRYLCNLKSNNNWADNIGKFHRINSIFEVTNNFGYNELKFYSILGCYGNASVCSIDVGNVNSPNFFRLPIDNPMFGIELSDKQIDEIERARNINDVQIDFRFKVLVSFSNESNYKFDNAKELNLMLNTTIPKSKWLEKFLSTWDYYNPAERIINIKKINEAQYVKGYYKKARESFASENYNSTLDDLYKVFEALPKQFNFSDVKSMFSDLMEDKAAGIKFTKINSIYKSLKDFMHLSRHDQTTLDDYNELVITKEDAYLALTLSEILVCYFLESLKMI